MEADTTAPETQAEVVERSPSIAALLAALADAQGEFPVVTKGKTAKAGANYSFTYATMADYAADIYPILSKHSLAFTCLPGWVEGKGFHMVGRLGHKSGEYVEGVLPLSGTNAQQIGASMSYARRQLFTAITGAVADDETPAEKANAQTAERAQNPKARKSTRAKATAAASAVAEGEKPDPWADAIQADAAGGTRITPAQTQKQQILFKEIGVEDRADRLSKTSAIVGRMVSSSNELTMDEGNILIGFLEQKKADLIADGTIAVPEPGPCTACGQINGAHSRTCPTQGRD